MKIAPIIDAIDNLDQDLFGYRLIHTGQHYDRAMSEAFFDQLKIPKPDVNLGVGSGSQAEQTSAIMVAYEDLLKYRFRQTKVRCSKIVQKRLSLE